MKKQLLNAYRAVFARPFFHKFNRLLFHMSMRGLGMLNYENSQVSGEEYLVSKVLKTFVKSKQPVFFDVGANVGDFSQALLRNFPTAQLHAFEPHPANFEKLKANVTSAAHHNLALGHQAGKLTLFDRADLNGSAHASLFADVISEIHGQELVSVDVEVDTLDNFAEREGVEYIDFLKIDTEGNELAVLQGATQLLQAGGIGCVHFEFNEMNVVSRVFLRDIRLLLKGYNLYRLLPNGLLPLGNSPLENELFAYQNILAVPESR